MAAVGLLHPGAMGAAVGAELARAGHTVRWASAGRSAATAARAAAAGLSDAGDVAGVVAASDIIMSICPPHAALDVARACAGHGGIFVDANAVAPATGLAAAAAAGGRTADGGIVGPPPVSAGTTRLFLSGAEAAAVAALFAGTHVEAVVLEGDPVAASTLKMAYAAWTKGSAALLLATERAARELGVDAALHAEWARSLPDLAGRLAGAERSAAEKGWRWAAEMEEIAATFAAAGQPDGFHRAAAAEFSAWPRDRGQGSQSGAPGRA
jgi:3-hydroxyisobutyrate dehydrogenase-like beta-hydroxyacid dehydrogenase